MSWSLCRVQDSTAATPVPMACTSQRLTDPNFESAPPLYSGFIFNPGDNTFKPLFPPVEGVMVSDLVAVQARAPLWIKSHRHGAAAAGGPGRGRAQHPQRLRLRWRDSAQHRARGSGTCPDQSLPSRSLANPVLCQPDDRPARFIRIEEAVPRFDRQLDMTLPNIDFGTAVGSGVGFMRTILGYAPIEPDGSVSVRVPANVPFTFSILDKDGRRLPQLRPRTVHGCSCVPARSGIAMAAMRRPPALPSSARMGAMAPAFPRGPAPMPAAFPSTLPAVRSGARRPATPWRWRVRAHLPVGAGGLFGNSAREPAGTRISGTPAPMPAVTLSLRYGGRPALRRAQRALHHAAPTSAGCQLNWNSTCRIVINYETAHPAAVAEAAPGHDG